MQKAGKWSQKRLSEESGVSQASISGYLKKKNAADLDSIGALADALGLSMAELLTDPEKTEIKPRVIEPTPIQALEVIAEALRAFEKYSSLKSEERKEIAGIISDLWDRAEAAKRTESGRSKSG